MTEYEGHNTELEDRGYRDAASLARRERRAEFKAELALQAGLGEDDRAERAEWLAAHPGRVFWRPLEGLSLETCEWGSWETGKCSQSRAVEGLVVGELCYYHQKAVADGLIVVGDGYTDAAGNFLGYE